MRIKKSVIESLDFGEKILESFSAHLPWGTSAINFPDEFIVEKTDGGYLIYKDLYGNILLKMDFTDCSFLETYGLLQLAEKISNLE